MKNKKYLLYILAFINFTHILDFMIIMPLGDIFMNIFEINPQQFSILVSTYTISAGIAGFLGIFFLDNLDRKKAIFFIYTGFIIGTICCAFSNSYETLLFFRSLTGTFGGLLSGLILTVVSDLFSFERRGAAIGIVMSAFSLASVLGVPLGLFLTEFYNWQISFYLIGGISVINLLLLLYIMPPMKEHLGERRVKKNPFSMLLGLIKDSNQMNALFFMFILILSHYLIIPFITPFMIRNVGFMQSEIIYIYLIGGGLMVFAAPYFGKMTDRFGALKLFTGLLFLSIIPIVVLTNLSATPVAIAIVFNAMFFVFVGGRMIPAQTMVTASVDATKRGSFMSMNSSISQFATAIGAFLSGLIINESMADGKLVNFNLVGGIAIVLSLATLFFAKKMKIIK